MAIQTLASLWSVGLFVSGIGAGRSARLAVVDSDEGRNHGMILAGWPT